MDKIESDRLVGLASKIVSAYVTKNVVAAPYLPELLPRVHEVLIGLTQPLAATNVETPRKPAVPIRKSVGDDFLICLEDGRRFKSLKRHLREKYDLTPEQYRARWRLPPDYPMVAPAYAQTRSRMAKSMGLGQSRRAR